MLAVFAIGAFAQTRTPRGSAEIDLTGNWVAVVDEDWRYRMLTPPKGDYAGVPINDAARQAADQWDRSTDGDCRAYGAPALMRMPTRLRITWEGQNVLKLESDAGLQTRRFVFDQDNKPTSIRSLQGHSHAAWQPGGVMKVVTNNLTAGWLRKNGVPYGEATVLTEYYDRFASPDGSEWFLVTTVVEDPKYLTQPFLTSTQFRKEATGDKWRPEPCKNN